MSTRLLSAWRKSPTRGCRRRHLVTTFGRVAQVLSFLSRLRLLGCIWFLCFPGVVACAVVLPPRRRMLKVTCSCVFGVPSLHGLHISRQL